MPNPQLEDGYTKIANELLEALSRVYLNPCATQTLFAFLRKTYGWSKKKDTISITQFQKMTGLSRQSQVDALRELVNAGLLVVNPSRLGNAYSLQKNYANWSSQRRLTGSQLEPKKVVNPSRHTKETLTKEIDTLGKAPELEKKIQELADKKRSSSPIRYGFQEEAFRFADNLGIKFPDEKIKTRWLGVFKECWGRNKKGALNSAYSYVSDHPGLITPEDKIKAFLWKVFEILKGKSK